MEEFNGNNNELLKIKIEKAERDFDNMVKEKSFYEVISLTGEVKWNEELYKGTKLDKENLVSSDFLESFDEMKWFYWQDMNFYTLDEIKKDIAEIRKEIDDNDEIRIIDINLRKLDIMVEKSKYWFFKKRGLKKQKKFNHETYFNDLKDELWIDTYFLKKKKEEERQREEEMKEKIKKAKPKYQRKKYFKEMSDDIRKKDEYFKKNSIEYIESNYYLISNRLYDYFYDDGKKKSDLENELEKIKKNKNISEDEWKYVYEIDQKYFGYENSNNFSVLMENIKKIEKETVILTHKKELEKEIKKIEKIMDKIWFWQII